MASRDAGPPSSQDQPADQGESKQFAEVNDETIMCTFKYITQGRSPGLVVIDQISHVPRDLEALGLKGVPSLYALIVAKADLPKSELQQNLRRQLSTLDQVFVKDEMRDFGDIQRGVPGEIDFKHFSKEIRRALNDLTQMVEHCSRHAGVKFGPHPFETTTEYQQVIFPHDVHEYEGQPILVKALKAYEHFSNEQHIYDYIPTTVYYVGETKDLVKRFKKHKAVQDFFHQQRTRYADKNYRLVLMPMPAQDKWRAKMYEDFLLENYDFMANMVMNGGVNRLMESTEDNDPLIAQLEKKFTRDVILAKVLIYGKLKPRVKEAMSKLDDLVQYRLECYRDVQNILRDLDEDAK